MLISLRLIFRWPHKLGTFLWDTRCKKVKKIDTNFESTDDFLSCETLSDYPPGKIYNISATVFLDDDLFIFAEKIEIDEIGDKKGE